MIRVLFAAALVSAAVVLSGCAEKVEPVAATPVNDVCPIMGGKVKPDGGSTVWNDQLIGFCCEGCLPEWEELSEEEKANKLADAKSGNVQDEHAEHDHSS